MRQIYSAVYFLIFIRFLRAVASEMFIGDDSPRMHLFIELPERKRSMLLATSVSMSKLRQIREAMITDSWNEDYLKITDEPTYEPVDIRSSMAYSIYDRALVGEIRDILAKFHIK